jgi:hypothetical protein
MLNDSVLTVKWGNKKSGDIWFSEIRTPFPASPEATGNLEGQPSPGWLGNRVGSSVVPLRPTVLALVKKGGQQALVLKTFTLNYSERFKSIQTAWSQCAI